MVIRSSSSVACPRRRVSHPPDPKQHFSSLSLMQSSINVIERRRFSKPLPFLHHFHFSFNLFVIRSPGLNSSKFRGQPPSVVAASESSAKTFQIFPRKKHTRLSIEQHLKSNLQENEKKESPSGSDHRVQIFPTSPLPLISVSSSRIRIPVKLTRIAVVVLGICRRGRGV